MKARQLAGSMCRFAVQRVRAMPFWNISALARASAAAARTSSCWISRARRRIVTASRTETADAPETRPSQHSRSTRAARSSTLGTGSCPRGRGGTATFIHAGLPPGAGAGRTCREQRWGVSPGRSGWRPPTLPPVTGRGGRSRIAGRRSGLSWACVEPAVGDEDKLADWLATGVSRIVGDSRRVLSDRKDATMAQTVPIPAGQPLDATRTAAEQVLTLRRRGGGRAGGSLPHAGRTAVAADPRSPRNGRPGQRAGPAAAATPAPGAAGCGHARIGRCRTGRDGAWGAPGAARAAAAITLRVEEEFVLLDLSTGATVLAGPELVRMLGGEPGVRQELMRFQVETGTRVSGLDDLGGELIRLRRLAAAAVASLGCWGLRGRAVPHARAGRRDRPARYQELACCYVPVPRRLPRARRGFLLGTRASRSWRGCGPGLRRCSPSPPTPRSPPGAIRDGPAAVPDPGTLAFVVPPRLGRSGRLRHGGPRPDWATAWRWMSGASTSWPGCPRAPHRAGLVR